MPPADLAPQEFRTRLLRWFAVNKRDLPWRVKEPRDPYSVVVSEVMLQQTQVTTVLRYYDRWMTAFPTFAALAEAPVEKVLKCWEGLGYYTRARNLKKLAEAVVANYGGILPQNVTELEKLPGIGPYSARSIASLAFNTPAACVDGNVVRVYSRLKAVDKIYKSGSAAQADFQKLADRVAGADISEKYEVASKFHYGEFNEALMEFGATVCTKANPACAVCPMQDLCRGFALGIAADLPRLERTKTEAKFVKRVWIMHEGHLLLAQDAAATGHLHGLYELPTPDSLGIRRLPKKELLRRVRNITKYKITEVIYKITRVDEMLPRLAKLPNLCWASPSDLKTLPLSGPHAQWIEEVRGRKNNCW